MEKINEEKFNALGQRQKKYAKTKVALLEALLEELESKTLEEVMIKKLCSKAEVSNPTFFNYFDSKSDMLVYFVQIWSIEMQILAQKCEKEALTHLDTIKQIFIESASQIAKHPQIMLEIIAFQATQSISKVHEISDGEKWYFFDAIEGVEALEGRGLESLLPPLIAKALQAQEIDAAIDANTLFLMLSSLFFGTALLILKRDPSHLPMMFEHELTTIFERIKNVQS